MKLSREKSKLIKGVITLVLVGGVTVGGITMYRNDFLNDSDTKASDTKFHEFMFNYYSNVEDPEMELFDQDFVALFNNGYLKVNEDKYSIKNVYIVKGKSNGNDCTFIQDFHKPTTDILTGAELPIDFKREKIMLLAYSSTFYNYYLNNKEGNNIELNSDNIDEFRRYVESFDATYNDKLPETYYYVHPKTHKSK